MPIKKKKMLKGFPVGVFHVIQIVGLTNPEIRIGHTTFFPISPNVRSSHHSGFVGTS